MLVAVLCSCQKYSEPVPSKSLKLDEFISMLSKERTYAVAAYYTSHASLDVPEVNSEDTYTFDGKISDAWVSSKQPCIEYHYNFRAFNNGSKIVLDWVDFDISPTEFTVEDYKQDEYFVLRSGDIFTRYQVIGNGRTN